MGAPLDVIDSLGKPEQFYLALLDIPRLESRLRAFLFKRQFEENVTRIGEDVDLASKVLVSH